MLIAVAAAAVLAAGGAVAAVLVGRDPGRTTTVVNTQMVTAGPTQTGGVLPTGGQLPDVSQEVMTADIRDLLVRFYRAQIDRKYVTERRLATARYRRDVVFGGEGGFEQWKINQGTGTRYFSDPENIQVEIVDTAPSDGSVAVEVSGMRYTDPRSACSTWEGTTWARYEDGRWLHDPRPTTTQFSDMERRGSHIIGTDQDGDTCLAQ